MKNSFNNVSDKRQRIEGVLTSLRQDFAKLAANPDQPGKAGPQFVRDDGHAMANKNDSLLGSMFVESFMGAAFGGAVLEALDAPSFVGNIDWGNAIDAYDEYNKDRAGAPAGDQDSLTTVRKAPVPIEELMDRAMRRAWENDMPARMRLEESFAHFSAMLDRLERADMGMMGPARRMKGFAPGMAA